MACRWNENVIPHLAKGNKDMGLMERGTKRICHACSVKYYDLGKPEPACPACGVVYNPEALLKSKHRYVPQPAAAKAPAKPTAAAIENDRLPPPIDDEDEVVVEDEEGVPVVADEDELGEELL